ncbi:hypothetical protein [Pandoraea apista]|uniref:hypothetical protein n=1 Tax=Pandoraea apista TaxID=93218 RepID=UPI000B8C4457|nr:hypothetical protein [Pandoraea apista]OXS92672.1 hypothetical protein B7H01_17195 [Pandoraea apista]
MIKARSGDLVILGLSRENTDRLQGGEPIYFDGDQIGLPGKRFLIMFGETETAIARELAEATSGGTA